MPDADEEELALMTKIADDDDGLISELTIRLRGTDRGSDQFQYERKGCTGVGEDVEKPEAKSLIRGS